MDHRDALRERVQSVAPSRTNAIGAPAFSAISRSAIVRWPNPSVETRIREMGS
ncbi:hypothetical protein [Halalkalicoccus salilacus]|uniref:hypothetical protein n=1 Tax=Halalkalicoccus sp. GCM10025704 TaxID=3252662 RepID=UPI0036126E17